MYAISAADSWNDILSKWLLFKCCCLAFLIQYIIPARRESSKYNRNYCIVTFDQLLFIKSVDIIAASLELSNIIPRLGRFHLLMSFMAPTGFIMAGSGLEQLCWTIFGSNGVTHMLDDHAYSRALRLHTLTAQAIVTILSETTDPRGSTKSNLV